MCLHIYISILLYGCMKSLTITRPLGFVLPSANDKQHSRLKHPLQIEATPRWLLHLSTILLVWICDCSHAKNFHKNKHNAQIFILGASGRNWTFSEANEMKWKTCIRVPNLPLMKWHQMSRAFGIKFQHFLSVSSSRLPACSTVDRILRGGGGGGTKCPFFVLGHQFSFARWFTLSMIFFFFLGGGGDWGSGNLGEGLAPISHVVQMAACFR